MTTNQKLIQRIGIVHPWGNFDSIPSLINTAILLSRHGYKVDVFTLSDDLHVPPSFPDEKGIEIVPLYAHRSLNSRKKNRWLPSSVDWRQDLLRRHMQLAYRCLIGVDPAGLKTAESMADFIRVPFVYYSLELLLSYELDDDQGRAVKANEVRASRRAAFTIIQDDERAGLLIKDNGLDPERVVCVPNAPLGTAEIRRSDFLRRQFSIPEYKKIMLHTGNLGTHMCSHQLVHSTWEWPEDWVLVYHTRLRYEQNERNYLAALRYLAEGGRVIFSTEPLPRDTYEDLVCSADIGVAYYCPTPGLNLWQDNIRYIGLSSGKFAYYLQKGIPVLVNSGSTLKQVVEENQCGVCTEDPAKTKNGISKILDNYDEYQKRALACFDNLLDVEKGFLNVIRYIERI